MKGFDVIPLVLWVLLQSSPVFAGDIALSFDDAPREDGRLYSGSERSKILLEKLKSARVTEVAFFINSIRAQGEGLERIESYARAGHLLGNHTNSHPDLDKTPIADYLKNIDEADRALLKLKGFQKFFRFPFLHEGNPLKLRDEVRRHLNSHGYKHAYVTVDSADWYMESLMQKALRDGKGLDAPKLCTLYSAMLWDGIVFFDNLAIQTLGSSPKHVLLLHENDLAALCLDRLIAKIRAEGWNIIPISEAYKDEMLAKDPLSLIANQGRIAALARDKGYAGSIWSKWEEETAIKKVFDEAKVFTPKTALRAFEIDNK